MYVLHTTFSPSGVSIHPMCVVVELAPLGILSDLLKERVEQFKEDRASASLRMYGGVLGHELSSKVALQVRTCMYICCCTSVSFKMALQVLACPPEPVGSVGPWSDQNFGRAYFSAGLLLFLWSVDILHVACRPRSRTVSAQLDAHANAQILCIDKRVLQTPKNPPETL